jgi:gliding motility-associated-like protein
MPNVFTPNGDGSNDYFKPFNLDNVVNFELLIYNRWGNLIYEGINLGGWDGKFNGSEVSDGVYFWIANYSGIDNQNQVLKGDVTLIR